MQVLTQAFPSGLRSGNRDGKRDEIVSAFPTLALSDLDLGVLFYEGVQVRLLKEPYCCIRFLVPAVHSP